MAASQNGFCSYKLSIHKKTNIKQIITKNLLLLNLIFYHIETVKLELCQRRSVMQPLQNPLFGSSRMRLHFYFAI
jgi:hypothetical protein